MKYKNLNIFAKPKTKGTIIKTITGVTAPLLLATSLTGCFSGESDFDKYYNHQNNYPSSDYSYQEDFDGYSSSDKINNYSSNSSATNNNFNSSLVLDDYLNKIINSNVVLDSNSLNAYINQINNLKVEYAHSNLYGNQELFNKYNSLQKYKSTTPSLFKNGQITVDTLYSVVKKNNENANLSNNQQLSDSNLREICSIMVNLFNDYAKRHNEADLNLLSEKISELKIINFDGFSNGFYDNTLGKMGFSVNYLKGKSNEFFKETIQHETHHLIQAASIKEISNLNLENRFGICYKFSDAEVNSLYWSWFYEGCAEYLTSNLNNKKTSNVYQDLIKSIDSIKISTILGNKRVDEFENISLSKDLNDLFKYFNCQTKEDKKEVLDLMYAFELKYNLNFSCKDFFDKYESMYGNTLSKLEFTKELNNSIAQTLSRYFYKNLALLLKNKQVSVQEIFSIISVFENQISREVFFSSKQESLELFFEMYNDMQSELFEMISKKLNVSLEEVQQAYNSFNKQVNVNLNNTVLLNKEKEEFLNYITENAKNHKVNSINYVSEKYNSIKKR